MITWKVWQALKHPPSANRLFQLTVSMEVISKTSFPVSVLLIVIVLLPVIAFASKTVSIVLSFLILIAIPILAIPQILNGSFCGLRWAIRTGSVIARMRRSGMYETLCLLPDGALGVNWAICTACLYWNGYREFDSRYTWPPRLFLILPAAIYFSMGSSIPPYDHTRGILVLFINIVTFFIWFRLEDIQSVVLGCLLGMFIPTYTRHKVEVSLWAAAVYLFIQLSLYTSLIVLAFSILPAIYDVFNLTGWASKAIIPMFSLTILYILREGINLALWHSLLRRLNIPAQTQVNSL